MKIEFVERKYKMSDKLKDIITAKINKLEKYFGSDAVAKVVASEQNKREKLEVTIINKGNLYRGEVTSDNMYNNIDLALPKIEKQIVRQNEKLRDRKRDSIKNLPFEFLDAEPEELPEVYKKKTFNLDPITVEDAKYMIERLDHQFFVFLNAETGKVNVLYRRLDNKFGLIEVNY